MKRHRLSPTSVDKVFNIEEVFSVDNNEFDLRRFTFAVKNDNESIVNEMIQKNPNISLNDIIFEEKTLLMLCVKYSSYAVFDLLISKGCDINKKDLNNLNPLLLACVLDSNEWLLNLIQNGADVNYKSKNNMTPLMVAAKYGYPTILKILIDNGADLNRYNRVHNTAFLLSIKYNEELIFNLLIDYVKNIDYQNKYGYTALMYSVISENNNMVIKIMNKCPDITLRNHRFQTALQIASDMKNMEIYNLIETIEKKNYDYILGIINEVVQLIS